MTDEAALLAAILANPADDTPRLVYADWLEENSGTLECPKMFGGGHSEYTHADWPGCKVCGNTGRISDGRKERAEFIRVQVELARLPKDEYWESRACRGYGHTGHLEPKCASCQPYILRDQLRRRERELWIQARNVMLDEFMDGTVARCVGIDNREPHDFPYGFISRGFVSALTCSWSDWSQHAAAILRAQPVERVRLTTWEVPEDIAVFVHGAGWRAGALAALAERWPRIEFELPPAQNNSATWQFNLDLAAAENR